MLLKRLHKPCSSSLLFLNRFAGHEQHYRFLQTVPLVDKLSLALKSIPSSLPSSPMSSPLSSPNKSSSVIQHQLLGPPEIYQTIYPPPPPPPTQEDQSVVDTSSSSAPSSPFINEMVANYNKYKDELGRTENGSPTFYTTGNPLLDFFFHIVPDTPPESLVRRLELAWKHDPLKALKLICNLRGVRGTGKSDKEGFHAAALWLHKNHPKTLACNVKSFAPFGYFKDLPDILYRLMEGLNAEKEAKAEHGKEKSKRYKIRRKRFWENKKHGGRPIPTVPREDRTVPREDRILAEKKKMELMKEQARIARDEKTLAKARKVVERYNTDPDYRFLHDCISDLFAECLVLDLKFLEAGKFYKISFASKWCPSLNLAFDQSTLMCESIARRIFPRCSYPEYEKIEEAHYVYRIRNRLRKEILVPLHRALELPEIYMSSNRWESLPYNRVYSVAMKNYTEIFMKRDKERFEEYLESVKRGENKIAAGALLPHQIIKTVEHGNGGGSDVAELQWKRMVEDLLETGKLKDCMAICDVSGSMTGTPMDVSVALGLLVSELSEEPWKGNLITFSTDPEMHRVKGESLRSKIRFVKNMQWNLSTDFQKVFDLILRVAVTGNLKQEQMIKRLFVFSDMEFNEASLKVEYWRLPANDWETDYQAIQRKFKEHGYTVPEIVFWNLRDSKATPVSGEQNGVALVSGFSKNLLRLFLEGDYDALMPLAVMERAISGKEYDDLVVVD